MQRAALVARSSLSSLSLGALAIAISSCATGGPHVASIDSMSIAAAPRTAPSIDAASTTSPNVSPRISYDALARELTERCGPKDTEKLDNMSMKVAVSDAATCKRKWQAAAIDRAVVATKMSDRARGDALAASEASFQRWVEVACWLSEEASWVDFEEGTRDDGTMRSYAWVACLDATAVERHFFARAIQTGDAAALAARIESRQAIGEKTSRALADMKDRAEVLLTTPIPPKNPNEPYPATLDHEARAELVAKISAVIAGAPALARDACAASTAATHALGGEMACVDKATRWILAQATFGMEDDDR